MSRQCEKSQEFVPFPFMNTVLILLYGESFKKFQTLVCLLVISKQKSKTLGSNSSHTHTHTHT